MKQPTLAIVLLFIVLCSCSLAEEETSERRMLRRVAKGGVLYDFFRPIWHRIVEMGSAGLDFLISIWDLVIQILERLVHLFSQGLAMLHRMVK